MAAAYVQDVLMARGMDKTEAGSVVTVFLICTAQLITGFGWFDTIAKFAGAGVIVPITGFANSMVSPAMEFKKEGPVLGAGAKLLPLRDRCLCAGSPRQCLSE